MTDITISYAVADQDRVATIVETLRREGYAVWWDRDIVPGADRKTVIAEQMGQAKLNLVAWSQSSVEASDVIAEAERAKGRRAYLGVLLDQVELPFGFGGVPPVEAGAVSEGVKRFMEQGQAKVAALEALQAPKEAGPNRALIFGIAGAAVLLVAAIVFFVMRGSGPTLGDQVEANLASTPCAWLRIDPVDNGANGHLGLVGVAGNPAAARDAVMRIIADNKFPIQTVAIDKVAQIDPRECPAIDEPRRLRRSPGGRLLVTGEPFIMDPASHQSLARVEIELQPGDKTAALFGVEPSGVVTWALPDIASLDRLAAQDVGLKKTGDRKWEFNIYPDHLGWTGLFLVVGDRPLAQTQPQLKVQRSGEFAQTLRAATAQGTWDADMVWFRIDAQR